MPWNTALSSSSSAGNNITIDAAPKDKDTAGGNIKIAGSMISSDKGEVSIAGKHGVTIENVIEHHESTVDSHKTSGGLFSSTTTDTHDYNMVNMVVGSTISGDSVKIKSGSDVTVKGSNIVGTNDVTIDATGNVDIVSAAETGAKDHSYHETTSGIFGSGLGFTIGSKSTNITDNIETIGQTGSTIGTTLGNVTITAGKKVNSEGTTFVAGKDLSITGTDVSIDNTINTYDEQYKYEFQQSGLSVSLGGGIINKGMSAYNAIQRSGQVQDSRLKEIYAYKAAKDLKELKDALGGNWKEDLSLSVSLGSTKMTSEQTTHAETVNTSNMTAGGNVTIKATEGNVNLTGTKIAAVDISLDAKKDININAAQNTEQTDGKTSSSSWSLGVSVGLNKPGGLGYSGNYQSGKGNETGNVVTNAGSIINASGTLKLTSGNDTNITGSQVKGNKVTATIDGNLNIASLQDTDTYTSNNQSVGVGFTAGAVTGGRTASFNKGTTDSNYASVTSQAGIFAGEDGFDIYVGKNTDLKGAVIASTATPDKNKLDTGSLTYSDIQNKADYSSSSYGFNVNTNPNSKYNEHGFTPNIGMPSSGDASSTTKSAISPGTIIVGGKAVNPEGLSRDTTNSLNALGKIFDKVKVEEQRELAGLFGELANEQLHKLSEQNGWADGSPEKVMLHTIIGTITAKLGGGNAFAGGFGAGLNEALQNELKKIGPEHPDLRQWASFIIGLASGDISGAVTAYYGTKYNSDNVVMDFITYVSFTLAGLMVVQDAGTKYIKNKSGQVLAYFNEKTGEWLDSAGNLVGNTYNSVIVWAKFEKAVVSGEPASNHSVDNSGRDLPAKGDANSSVDKLNPDGTVKQRRYYGPDGRALEDIDYNHTDGDGTHTFPHRHTWDWSKTPPRQK